MAKELFNGDKCTFCQWYTTDGSPWDIISELSHGEDLRYDGYDALKKKWANDTVNDKFPAAAFVSRHPTLNSVYASLSKNNDLSHDSALAYKNGDA